MNKRIRDKKVEEYVGKFRLYRQLSSEVWDIEGGWYNNELFMSLNGLRKLYGLCKIHPKKEGESYSIYLDGIRFHTLATTNEFYGKFPELKPKPTKNTNYIEIDGVKYIAEQEVIKWHIQ